MNNFFVAISLVAFVPIVGAVFGDEPQSDFVKLQGTWRGTIRRLVLNLTVDGHEFKTYVRVKSSAQAVAVRTPSSRKSPSTNLQLKGN